MKTPQPPVSELLAASARSLIAKAHERGLSFLFDYRGPQLFCTAACEPLEQVLGKLLRLAIERARGTLLVFTAEARLGMANAWSVQVRIGASGLWLDEAELARVLGVHDAAPPPGEVRPAESVATRLVCPLTRVVVTIHRQAREGTLLRVDLEATRAAGPLPPVDVNGAVAWLIASDPWAFESLTTRLQRLGWRTRTLPSIEQAHTALREPGALPPALVVGLESYGVFRRALARFAQRLDPRCIVVLGLDRLDGPRATDDRLELQALPFSTLDLLALSRRAVAEAASPGTGKMPRPQALLVDDNAVNQLLGAEVLKLLGYDVSVARDGHEAIARCRERTPVLVLMDIQMPRMDGLHATRELRRLQSEGLLQDFPIVAATAYASGVDEPTCRAAGMDGYLHKPLDPDSLRAMLRTLGLPDAG